MSIVFTLHLSMFFLPKCKIPTIDFCIECQNFTIQSQPNGGEIWVSSNLVERQEEEEEVDDEEEEVEDEEQEEQEEEDDKNPQKSFIATI